MHEPYENPADLQNSAVAAVGLSASALCKHKVRNEQRLYMYQGIWALCSLYQSRSAMSILRLRGSIARCTTLILAPCTDAKEGCAGTREGRVVHPGRIKTLPCQIDWLQISIVLCLPWGLQSLLIH